MEKLIELLNEYEKKSEVHWYEWYGQDVLMCRYIIVKDGFEFYTDEAVTIAISKYYGFIKWLVENEKIDIKALVVKGEMRSGWDFDNKKGNEESGEESWNKYYSELCLMILAIQDEPISFLISILK